MSYLFSGAIDQSGQAAEKALDLSPTFALAHLGVGLARLYSVGAVQPVERGLRLNPFDPQKWVGDCWPQSRRTGPPNVAAGCRGNDDLSCWPWRPRKCASVRRAIEAARETGQRCPGSGEAPQSALGEGRCRCAPGG